MVILRPGTTAGAALAHLRGEVELPDFVYYLYVVEASGKLCSVVTLRELVLAPPEARVESLMTERLITGNVDDEALEVARQLAHYHLLALPILDADGCLVGIVTSDSAMDLLLPDPSRNPFPGVFGGREA
jgi:magnesium transporter